tara:strand:+ start:113 stop:577 length:465 start_codon:yes stop_codon:yes gene_type:complete
MNSLRKQIKKEIKTLMEGSTIRRYPAPDVVIKALKELFPGPLKRFVDNLKQVNSTTPRYRVFLKEGGKYFDLVLEEMSVVIEIGPKSYWLVNVSEKQEAIRELDRLLLKPVYNLQGDEETDDSDSSGGGSTNSDTAFDDDGDDEEDESEETDEV